jgi:putative oxidoreductase
MTTATLNPSAAATRAGAASSTTFQDALALASRVLIAVMFLPAGINKISGFAGTAGYIGSVGLPMPMVGAAIAIAVEVLGGLALLAGWRTRSAALVLAGFTLVASVFFHAYWAAPADQAMVQQLMFFKNIAIIGGLLALAAFGPGAWSVDGHRRAA